MSTSGLIQINRTLKNGKTENLVSILKHWDGYPSHTGFLLLSFLKERKIVNGLSHNDTDKVSNSALELSAQLVTFLKNLSPVGDVYLNPFSKDNFADYTYILDFKESDEADILNYIQIKGSARFKTKSVGYDDILDEFATYISRRREAPKIVVDLECVAATRITKEMIRSNLNAVVTKTLLGEIKGVDIETTGYYRSLEDYKSGRTEFSADIEIPVLTKQLQQALVSYNPNLIIESLTASFYLKQVAPNSKILKISNVMDFIATVKDCTENPVSLPVGLTTLKPSAADIQSVLIDKNGEGLKVTFEDKETSQELKDIVFEVQTYDYCEALAS